MGLVKRDPFSGDYEPGPLALRLGFCVWNRLLPIGPHAASPCVGPAGWLQRGGLYVGPKGPTIVRYEHAGLPLHVNLHIGTVMALQTTSTGRVFCAYASAEQRKILLAGQQGSDLSDQASLADQIAFESRLAEIRKRGMERSINTPSPGISSLCAPVCDQNGQLCLALTIIGATGSIDVKWNGCGGNPAGAHRKSHPRGPCCQFMRTSIVLSAPRIFPGSDRLGERRQTAARNPGARKQWRIACCAGFCRHAIVAARSCACRRHAHRQGFCAFGQPGQDRHPDPQRGWMLFSRPSQSGTGFARVAATVADQGGGTENPRDRQSYQLSVATAVLGPLGPTVVQLEESMRPLHVSLRIGTVLSLVNTAIGRVFAAHLSAEILANLLQQDAIRLAGEAQISTADSARSPPKKRTMSSLGGSHRAAWTMRWIDRFPVFTRLPRRYSTILARSVL